METLSSPSGEKLLISGWWGWLRHPNYLGEIIIHLAFIMTSGKFHFTTTTTTTTTTTKLCNDVLENIPS